MPTADASGRLLDDLRALVERHGADEIVLHLDPTHGEWLCAWGEHDSRYGSARDADLAAAVRRMVGRAAWDYARGPLPAELMEPPWRGGAGRGDDAAD